MGWNCAVKTHPNTINDAAVLLRFKDYQSVPVTAQDYPNLEIGRERSLEPWALEYSATSLHACEELAPGSLNPFSSSTIFLHQTRD